MNTCMNYAIPMSISLPTMSREDFADRFDTVNDFLFYVNEEHTCTIGDYKYTLYENRKTNEIIIEEEPIDEVLKVWFRTTHHRFTIDESWRYIAMDWFDHVCSAIWDTH